MGTLLYVTMRQRRFGVIPETAFDENVDMDRRIWRNRQARENIKPVIEWIEELQNGRRRPLISL